MELTLRVDISLGVEKLSTKLAENADTTEKNLSPIVI